MHIQNITIGTDVDVSDGVSLNNITTGNNGKIRHQSILFGTPKHPLTIGNDFFIGVQCYLNGVAGITIGDRVTIAHGCMLFTDSGPNTSPLLQKDFPITAAPITIGNDVWLGAHATVMPGVTIGDHCVIGANSVIKTDIPAHSVVAGSPARIIRTI